MQEDHHFCRWHLPEGHCADAALAAAFPGASRAQAAHQLDTCCPKELREVFATIFGSPTTSNNTSWIRQKLKGALGLGGKKQRSPGSGGRKRPSGGGGGRSPAKHARTASPEPEAWGAAAVHPAGRSPRLGCSPSSDWDCFSYEAWSEEQGVVDSSAAVEGAATLLAAAAEVESREAAAAAAAAAATAGTGALLQGGSGGASGISGTDTAHATGARASPDSPGGSATGSSLAPPPAASQQVQALLHNCLRLAAPAPAAPTSAAPAQLAPAPARLQASFLTSDQLGKVQQQVAVLRLLAAMAGAPNGRAQ